MMGEQPPDQNALFYAFSLEKRVPKDHLLRQIDAFLDFSALRKHLAGYYSPTGRPSIDPELMLRMLLIGYCYGIRSERRLCEEVDLNLAYRWFCRLGLDGAVPDHSTFSKNRHGRFRDAEVFRFVFEQVVGECIEAGLVAGEGFAVDASVVKADASRQRTMLRDDDDDWPTPPGLTRPVREYLAALDDGHKPPKRLSLTDPEAQWTAAPGGPAFFAYSTNYLIDTEAGVIVDVEATTANRVNEVNSTKTMIERVLQRFAVKPQRLIGDTAYGTAELLNWMVSEQGIEPHVPVWDKGERSDGTFSRSDFQFDGQTDSYTCPGGHTLKRFLRSYKTPRTGINEDGSIRYRAPLSACRDCTLKPRCCPNSQVRTVARSLYEPSRDVARAVAKTPAYRQTRKDRKKVEMLFGHLKRILKLDRLRLRGLTGAHDEFLLAATAQNLRRMAKYATTGPPRQRLVATA